MCGCNSNTWRSFVQLLIRTAWRLSDFKPESGSDARYLSDLIRRMTGCPAYLDSTDLVELHTLFDCGVHKSDVLVVLATESVFTRPWWCVVSALFAGSPSPTTLAKPK